jgi:hypothetical protein
MDRSLLPSLCDLAFGFCSVAAFCCIAENKGAGVCHFAEAARLRSYVFDTHPIPNFIRVRITNTTPLFSIQKKFFISIFLRYIFLVHQGNRLIY